jgi:hypothetical protein
MEVSRQLHVLPSLTHEKSFQLAVRLNDSRAGLEERGERNAVVPAGDQTLVTQRIPIHYTD